MTEKLKTTPDLKNCPFCNSNNLEIVLIDNRFSENTFYAVQCLDYLSKGGEGIKGSQAVLLWNIRIKNNG